MSYTTAFAHRMFEGRYIPYYETLTAPDFEYAAKLLKEGMSFDEVLKLVKSWAHQYHFDGIAETKAHKDFCRNAY